MKKAEQKIEYRWDDFLSDTKNGKLPIYDYPPVDFDTRFYYYVQYREIADDLLEPSTREVEEGKAAIWELEGLDLELAMAMDPESFAAKAMSKEEDARVR